MSTTELKQKFENLKTKASRLEIKKAKAEQSLETLETKRDTLLETIESIAKTKNIDEAKEKSAKLGKKLDALIAQADEIIDNANA